MSKRYRYAIAAMNKKKPSTFDPTGLAIGSNDEGLFDRFHRFFFVNIMFSVVELH